MENWKQDIVAEETPEVSECQSRAEETIDERARSPKSEYFLRFEEMSRATSVERPSSPAPRRPVPTNFIESQMMISDNRHQRADIYRAWTMRQDKAKLNMSIQLAKAPEVKRVSKAEVFAPKLSLCQDEELAKIKEKAALAKAEKEATKVASQLKHNQARALVAKLENEAYAHSEIRTTLHKKNAGNKVSPDKSSAASISTLERTEGEASGIGQVIEQLVLDEKMRDANKDRADDITSDLADMKLEHQPMDVFQRMWTPVSIDNPIWKQYRNLLRDLKEKRAKGHRELAACSQCLTIFFPSFPADHHIHQRSKGFGTAIDERRVESCLKAMVEASEENEFHQTVSYKALVGLAKEAKAYMKNSTGEYIKLIRLATGTRSHRGKGKYSHTELCENCNVESDAVGECRKRYKLQNLAAGILKLIFILCYKVHVPSRVLRPNHYGAGLVSFFDFYRSEVEEFEHELIYRGFLTAFSHHVAATLELDSQSHPVTHWWNPPAGTTTCQFLDSSKGNARSEFDKAGCQKLAHNLAVNTFRELDLYFTIGSNRRFLGSAAKLVGNKFLEGYLEDMPKEIADEKLDVPDIAPVYATPKELVGVKKGQKISEAKLSKRPPELSPEELATREYERNRKAESRKRAALKKKKAQEDSMLGLSR